MEQRDKKQQHARGTFLFSNGTSIEGVNDMSTSIVWYYARNLLTFNCHGDTLTRVKLKQCQGGLWCKPIDLPLDKNRNLTKFSYLDFRPVIIGGFGLGA